MEPEVETMPKRGKLTNQTIPWGERHMSRPYQWGREPEVLTIPAGGASQGRPYYTSGRGGGLKGKTGPDNTIGERA